jgi:IS5 family transposase
MRLSQVEMVSLEDLVSSSHDYRKFCAAFDFSALSEELRGVEKDAAYKGYGAPRLFKSLLLQFMEDLSDRELMRYLQENTAAKWFCDFTLTEKTPDFSVFSRFRQRIGTSRLAKMFGVLRAQLRSQGYMSEIFTLTRRI